MPMQELLDIYDEQDRYIGTCERAEVHRLGHWHHTFHCWLIRDTPDGRMLVFQKRHHSKDTFPNLYDITAAGHLSAGETLEEAAREIEEELGIPMRFEQLTHLIDERYEERGATVHGAFIDREVSSVFGAFSPLELHEYRLQDDEVAGIFEASLTDMLELFSGKRPSVPARGIYTSAAPSSADAIQVKVTMRDFVPHSPHYGEVVFQKLLDLRA